MQQKYTGRVIAILAVLVLSLYFIFPKGNIFKPNLKPGIDMVGGTSLLYEIKPPSGTIASSDLAKQVMTALKRRVDPQGVRNLIWRPQGATRLEIQMPSSGNAEQAKQFRDAFTAVQEILKNTNVQVPDVMDALRLPADQRAARLNELAMGSAKRTELFKKLAATYDDLERLKQQQNDFQAQANAERDLAKLKSDIEDTNLSTSQLQSILDAPKVRDKKLEELKKEYGDFPKRLEAIDKFTAGYDRFRKVKDTIDDAAELKRQLRGSGVLEFHILANDISTPELQKMVDRLKKRGPRIEAGDTMRWFQVERPNELPGANVQEYNGKYYALAYITPEKSLDSRTEKKWVLRDAKPEFQEGGRAVAFEFDAQGADYFGRLTASNLQRPLAIVLDEKIISAPNINSKISANGVITGGKGGFSPSEQDYLANTLRAGALPAQLAEEPISERTIGPQLGRENLVAGLQSCFLGLVVVGIFMIVYYFRAGVVAIVALLMNILMILGIMAAINATFTLPAIAGIVLTIGIAVDANVLIFERLREEQMRGLSLRMALRNAYDRAFSAIVDSNVTTAITCGVLYMLGSEEVKGFGLTLLLGLAASVFTALFVTKTIFGIWIDHFGLQKLSSLPLAVPAWHRLLHPKIDWMSKIGYFLALSAVLIVLGVAALIVKFRQGAMFDIEFASGTGVQFELKQPMEREALEKQLDAAAHNDLPSMYLVSVGKNDKTTYELVTVNSDAVKVKAAVLRALEGQLNLETPSQFASVNESAKEALANGTIVPLTVDKPFEINGWSPPEAMVYRDGAAIILRNLEPALSANDIKARIDHQELQPQPGGGTTVYHDFKVVTQKSENAPANLAVVFVNDANLPYDRDPVRWEEEVVNPMWKLVNEAITRPAQLQKVTTFSPQVAAETASSALLALVMANAIIMAYIWLRFGNFKFGAATVVAMLHDTIIVVGLLGLSHYLGQIWFFEKVLLIEPIRINLTVVAGVLTIMGYSMVDTIVVFDRIRENRGKFGHLDRQIVNDSINQTLSRTLLTAGTTLMTVFVMYIFGGPAIHGFTFALLVGILIGTYSSIAIASPILLIGQQRDQVLPAQKKARIATA